MFGGLKYNKLYLAELFQGGTVYQAFLSALSYHRWHSPVNGVIK
jgi:phosphatidylserine decarboxylase